MMEPLDSFPLTITLQWVLRLRWWAAAGQLATAVATRELLGLHFSLGWVVALIAATAGSNLILARMLQRGMKPSERGLAGILLLDMLLLTALLALTGGPNNPFSVLYMVHITLAAVVLGPRWAWPLVALGVGSYGALFLLKYGGAPAHLQHGHYPFHLQGMWVAFGIAACVITYFVTRIATELRAREVENAALRDRAARSDKLAALSTLAAGAAHELGTPLSTIALVARELECSLDRGTATGLGLRDDAHLIRTEVERCREILRQLHADAGQTLGELPEPIAAEAFSEQLRRTLGPLDSARVVLDCALGAEPLRVPQRTFLQILRSLVRNALDAGPDAVTVRVHRIGDALRVRVEDRGSGMPPEVLRRAGEPFFTTKPPGRGMGLGLFLARAVAERFGGSLELSSTLGVGTVATLDLPWREPHEAT